MAHYAFLDKNNIVIDVIVGKDENEDGINWESYYGELRAQSCKRTSFNTYANTHLSGGNPYRKNYAGIGFYYDSNLDAFIPPKPYNSWHLNANTCIWESPISHPMDNNVYHWNEQELNWVKYDLGDFELS